MKKIGYIFKYDEQQEKGILVYGHNCEPNWDDPMPIKFGKGDCNKDVQTGQLVLFDLSGKENANKIEPVSLYNFNRNLLADVVSCYDKFTDNMVCEEANIVYENLFYEDFDFDKCILDLPESIDDIYNLFASRIHSNILPGETFDDNFCSVDILDFQQWAANIGKEGDDWYGKTSGEVLDLFELFVNKRRNAYRSLNFAWKYDLDDSISPSWELLLSYLSESELRKVIQKAPMLQPALPKDFAINNLDVLSVDYGFPSTFVCESFYRYNINNIDSTIDYLNWKEYIKSALRCSKNHKKEEGIQACQLQKDVLTELRELLESIYTKQVLPKLKQKVTFIQDINKDQLKNLLYNNKECIFQIGTFIDLGENNKGRDSYYDFIDSYNALNSELQIVCHPYMLRKSEEWILLSAQACVESGDIRPLITALFNFDSWVSLEIENKVGEITSSVITSIDDLDDLHAAFKCNLLSEKKYFSLFKSITKDYTIEQYLRKILWSLSDPLPLSVQRYILNEVIRLFDIKDFWEIEHIKIDNETIDTVPELLRWINEKCHNGYIDQRVSNEIVGEIVKKLSDEDKQYLLDEKIITSLSLDQNSVQDAAGKFYNFDSSNFWDEPADYREFQKNRYAGSFAQDEMGYSNDDIDTIFDGDPDAYWNID